LHGIEQELTVGLERGLVTTEVSWRGLQSAMAAAAARDGGKVAVPVERRHG
jgi:hypothetical protein